jgi:hypothetical protein
MSRTVSLDNFASAIAEELTEYANGVTEATKKCVDKAAKECKQGIQKDSPVKTGGYKKGWRLKTDQNTPFYKTVIVYQAKKPGLTHLLENGHARRRGGRTRAFPHIKPNEEKAIENLPRMAEEAITRV